MDKVTLMTIKEKLHKKLEIKTGWGRNEIKAIFDEIINELLFEELEKTKEK